MVTETDALQRLSIWFKTYHWKVLQDKKNDNDNQLFHVKGESTKKPDIIGISPNGYTIALEVKSGEDGRDLGNYSKLMTYFENYNENKTFYYDNNEIYLKIYDFMIATYFSPDGHLKTQEPLHIDREGSHRIFASKNGLAPTKEYETTFTLVRRGIWDHTNYDKYRTFKTGIGVLLSSVLDNEKDSPAIFVMKPNFNTYKWRHLWLKYL